MCLSPFLPQLLPGASYCRRSIVSPRCPALAAVRDVLAFQGLRVSISCCTGLVRHVGPMMWCAHFYKPAPYWSDLCTTTGPPSSPPSHAHSAHGPPSRAWQCPLLLLASLSFYLLYDLHASGVFTAFSFPDPFFDRVESPRVCVKRVLVQISLCLSKIKIAP